MIYSIYSNMPGFKTLHFRPNMNILLADKDKDSTDLQTRNGVGKTSLVELVHFLLGSVPDKTSIFKADALKPFTFGMEFDLAGSRMIVERSARDNNRIVLKGNIGPDWPRPPRPLLESGTFDLTNSNWRIDLGYAMFGLPDDGSMSRYGPTFRSLVSYFARRQQANAFISPIKQSSEQQLYNQQVAISYLIGADWTISQRWEDIRQREKALKELKKAAAGGSLGAIIGMTAELRTKLAVAEERLRRLRQNLSTFQVLPEYREVEQEATDLTEQLGSLADDNTIDRRNVEDLRRALQEEVNPSVGDLQRVYEEAGVSLPEVAIRRFNEVENFHKSIVDNRRSYLSAEIDGALQRIAQRETDMMRMDRRRSELLEILRSHGALDQFTKLQSELSRKEAEAERLRQQFDAAQQLEGEITQLDIERRQLLLRLQQDLREQSETFGRAILAFEETSSSLYENAGSLTIQDSANGPVFDVSIPGQKSKGISNMQIFCFDMMLMRLCTERSLGPKFLIHDSHLFDGVDERQVAKALQIGMTEANSLDFQYIVTMNSDTLPRTFPDGFRVEDFILPVRLTDATEDGGLFGRRFG